jgi:hypothetical protein
MKKLMMLAVVAASPAFAQTVALDEGDDVEYTWSART